MKVKIKRSGNSAVLRIPADVLKALSLSVGEELTMRIYEKGFKVEKEDNPRANWFDSICDVSAKKEAEIMEKDFGSLQNTDLDEWEHGEEW